MLNTRFFRNIFIILIYVVLDQVSKLVVELYLPFHKTILIMPYTALYRTWNEGVAFSFLSGYPNFVLVLIVGVALALVIFLWFISPAKGFQQDIGYGLILGGAVGNLIDRTVYGHVVDFILFYYKEWSFPIFNVADIFICIGVILIISDEVLGKLRIRRKLKNSSG